MTPNILENTSTWFVDWSLVTIMGNTTPPRDPNDENDEEDEDEASLPVLATGDAVAVDDALKPANIGERRIELVGKLQIVAAVGDEDEDAKLALVERVGSARLLWSYVTGFRRSRTGCVMRDVCHCTAPIAALNISTFGKVGGSATSRQVLRRRLAHPLVAMRRACSPGGGRSRASTSTACLQL